MSVDNHTAIPSSPPQLANAATINSPLAQLDAAMGNVATLTLDGASIVSGIGTAAPTTTAKTLVGAVNELDAEIGSSALTTTAQTLAGAINELDADIGDVSTLNTTPHNSLVAALGTAPLTTTYQQITSAVNELDAEIGSSALTTTAQTLTGAINELDADIGDVSTLNTTPHNSLVAALGTAPLTTTYQQITSAINELDQQIGAAASASGSIGTSIDVDGTLKQSAVGGLMTGSANVIWDPFNRDTSPAIEFGSGAHWKNASALSIVNPDAANPYGAPTLRFDTSQTLAGKYIWFAECGVKVGDVISASAYVLAASGEFKISIAFYNAADGYVSNKDGAETAFSGTAKTLTVANFAVPATAVKALVFLSRVSGSAVLDIYAMWASNSAYIGALPTETIAPANLWAEIIEARGGYADIDARFDAIAPYATQFPPLMDVYGKHFLRDWQAQIAKILAADSSSQAIVAVVGDSWIAHGYITAPLTVWLQAKYGDAGDGYCSAYVNGDTPAPVGVTRVKTGTWTDSVMQATSRGVDFTHTTSVDTATPGAFAFAATAHAFVIHYLKQVDGGTFHYKIDAGGWTDVDTAHTSSVYSTVTIGSLDGNAHTLTIEVTVAGSAGVTLMGVDVQRTGNGVRVHSIGLGGLATSNVVAVDETIWKAGLTALAPNVVVVLLGTNDDSADVVPATFNSRMDTIVDRIQSAVSAADIILLTPTANGLADGDYTMDDYVSELRNVAVNQGAACLDAYMNMGTYAAGNARGLYLNTSHLNATGGRMVSNLLIEKMLRIL